MLRHLIAVLDTDVEDGEMADDGDAFLAPPPPPLTPPPSLKTFCCLWLIVPRSIGVIRVTSSDGFARSRIIISVMLRTKKSKQKLNSMHIM